MAFYPLERLMNLYDGYQKCFMVTGHPILLIQNEGKRYVLLDQCPHKQAPLSRGTLAGDMIRCPAHGMSFSLITGKTDDGCNESLKYIDIVYEGTQLGIDV